MLIKHINRALRPSGVWATCAVVWLVIGTGMYLWSVREMFGIEREISLPIEIKASSGALDITCSIHTPLRTRHTYDLLCAAKIFSTSLTNSPIEIGIAASGDGFMVSPSNQHTLVVKNTVQDFNFQVTPISSGYQNLVLSINADEVNRASEMQLDVELKPFEMLLFSLILAVPLTLVFQKFTNVVLAQIRARELVEARLVEVENKAERAPEKAQFAWELATVRLQAYFDKNLSQVNQVFWLAVIVTLIGFCFVLWGIVASLNQPQITARALVAGISGIITQFIGATFLVIYRSIMAQANKFIGVLERINTVGMAVQVLDSIPENQVSLKNSTRSHLVSLLLNNNSTPIGMTDDRPRQ